MGNTRVVYTPVVGPYYTGYDLSALVDYFPYGKELRSYYNGESERYLTTHHERDGETGLDYRGARFYDSDNGRFLSLDPLAMEFASWSGYNYVLGNPVMLIDPDGKKPDWVKNEQNCEYEWMDNVTSSEDTPEGYTYVGSKNEDIVTNLGMAGQQSQTSGRFGQFVIDHNQTGSVKSSVGGSTHVKTESRIDIKPIVTFNPSKSSENNKGGKEFGGIEVSVSLATTIPSANGVPYTSASVNVQLNNGLVLNQGMAMTSSQMFTSPNTEVRNYSFKIHHGWLDAGTRINSINVSSSHHVRSAGGLAPISVPATMGVVPLTIKHTYK